MDLKPKRVKGRIRVLRVLPYKGIPVYLRMIDTDIFEYLLIFDNQIYQGSMIFKPRQGQQKLSKSEILSATNFIYAGAMTTVQYLLGETVKGEQATNAQAFLDATEGVKNG